MAILEDEVIVNINLKHVKYYEDKCYEIPRKPNSRGKMVIAVGSEIIVKVDDLPKQSSAEVTKVCDICGKKKKREYGSILKERRRYGKDICSDCSAKYNGQIRKNSVSYEKTLESYAINNNKDYLLNEFSNKNTKRPNEISKGTNDEYLWNCPKCLSEYTMSVKTRTTKDSLCPYCSGTRINDTNCLWTTHPHIARLLRNQKRGYKLTSGSSSNEDFICNTCNHEIKGKRLATVVSYGLACPKCSDGISYPEKFLTNVLLQLGADFKTQKTFQWSEGRVYDHYIKSINCIIEEHGMQHYTKGFEYKGGRNLEEEQENDRHKEKLAKENGIENYIVIDCAKSDMEYIKNKILSSKLRKLFDLDKVNWSKCHEYACKSLVKTACDLWNEDLSPSKIVDLLNISHSTLSRYLKQGNAVGWCKYNPLQGQKKSKRIIQLSLEGEYIREWDGVSTIIGEFDNVSIQGLYGNLNGKSGSSSGYRWMYKDDYDKRKNNLIIYRNNSLKRIVRLDLFMNYIDEWEGIKLASDSLSVNRSSISLVCNNKKKSAGGFKWMYKEDYEKYINQVNQVS